MSKKSEKRLKKRKIERKIAENQRVFPQSGKQKGQKIKYKCFIINYL